MVDHVGGDRPNDCQEIPWHMQIGKCYYDKEEEYYGFHDFVPGLSVRIRDSGPEQDDQGIPQAEGWEAISVTGVCCQRTIVANHCYNRIDKRDIGDKRHSVKETSKKQLIKIAGKKPVDIYEKEKYN